MPPRSGGDDQILQGLAGIDRRAIDIMKRAELSREFSLVRPPADGGDLEPHVPCVLDAQTPEPQDDDKVARLAGGVMERTKRREAGAQKGAAATADRSSGNDINPLALAISFSA
jgi:hypothetical protein